MQMIFPALKMENHWGKMIFFKYLCSNIDCGYTLEPPRRVPITYVLKQKIGKKVYLCIPQFCYIKVGIRAYTLHGHVYVMCVTCIDASHQENMSVKCIPP